MRYYVATRTARIEFPTLAQARALASELQKAIVIRKGDK